MRDNYWGTALTFLQILITDCHSYCLRGTQYLLVLYANLIKFPGTLRHQQVCKPKIVVSHITRSCPCDLKKAANEKICLVSG